AGAIKKASPAGKFLTEAGVAWEDFNSYGSRRGNDRIMTRGTFANVRIKNLMCPGTEGGVTMFRSCVRENAGTSPETARALTSAATGEQMPIFDAAMKYAETKTPLMIFAGQEYGTGSSRDWAAKGTALLGVKAVVAQSFERIHRSNLCGMGVVPLQFPEGITAQTLKLDGRETFDLLGLSDDIKPMSDATLVIHRADGTEEKVTLRSRIDTAIEVEYVRHGGILPYVLRQLLA
ncbi:MAG: aconitate hydratase, partial [Chthoniobacteraceae bacterium]